jgi:hypothetical protein
MIDDLPVIHLMILFYVKHRWIDLCRGGGRLLPRAGNRGAGVYVGGWRDDRGRLHYLRHNGPERIAAIAPTRSGKGIGLVVPTLLSWPHSLVVNDQKAELWHLSAGWRAQEAGNIVLRFDPGAASGSIGFNPLAEIRLGTPREVGDVQNLVTILVDPDGKGLVELGRNRRNRRPPRRMLSFMIQDHTHRPRTDLRRKFVRRLRFHGSYFSRVGASGNPGAVQGITAPVAPVRQCFVETYTGNESRGYRFQSAYYPQQIQTERISF